MANNLTTVALELAEKANDSMTKLTESMRDISKASDETAQIVKTIDETAF